MAEHLAWRPFASLNLMRRGVWKPLLRADVTLTCALHSTAMWTVLEQLSWSLDGVFVDMSKQKWDAEVLEGLSRLGREADVAGAISDLFGGVKLNVTEDRAVLHMALRANHGDSFQVDGKDVGPKGVGCPSTDARVCG